MVTASRIFPPHDTNPGDHKPIDFEKKLEEVSFKIYKFNNRTRPKDKNKILIISCFSEFGCETVGVMYCIPKILQMNVGVYAIGVGWHGREYLYRHLLDEFWELDEEYQWLREYSLAFNNHRSWNLEKIEESLQEYGKVFQSAWMGRICLGNTCRDCKYFWGCVDPNAVCENCGGSNISRSLLSNIPYHRKFGVQVPRPSIKMLNEAKRYLKPNPVGIFARNRACYGRNLPPEFYVKLIALLEGRGYNPIWLGEKQSTLPCPVPHIIDFSRLPESKNLELTLAIISKLEFTIQFWTASTRLASMMGVPWILFESPDQLAGLGQEGLRIKLTTDPNKKKIVVAHYLSIYEDHSMGLRLVDQALDEMQNDNWDNIMGAVCEQHIVQAMFERKGGFIDNLGC